MTSLIKFNEKIYLMVAAIILYKIAEEFLNLLMQLQHW